MPEERSKDKITSDVVLLFFHFVLDFKAFVTPWLRMKIHIYWAYQNGSGCIEILPLQLGAMVVFFP